MIPVNHPRLPIVILGISLVLFTTRILKVAAEESVPIAYEGFDYPAGKSLTGLDGGVGFTSHWSVNRDPQLYGRLAKEIQPDIVAASLEYPGLKTTGGACRIHRSDRALVRSERSLFGAFRPGIQGQTLYLAFLMKPEGVLGAGTLNGYFCVGLHGHLGNIYAGKPGADRPDRYVLEEQGGNGQVAGTVAPVVNETALLVLKVELREGPDPVTLFVNPKVGPLEPKDGITKADCDLGIPETLVLYSTGAHIIDELRLGRTFAEVLPPAAPRK